jgi:hypothetical protein
MANAVTIPTLADGTAFYTLRTTLDGADYQLEFSWSEQEERWFLTVRDSLDVLLCGPLKIVCNWPLLRYYHHVVGLPEGELIASTVAISQQPPGIYDLAPWARVQLLYLPVADV